MTEATFCNRILGQIDLLLDGQQDGKISTAINIIKQAFQRYGVESVAVAFNGGKDCTVLLFLCLFVLSKLASSDQLKLNVIYVVEQEPFDEIELFVNEIGSSIPSIAMSRMTGKLKNATAQYIQQNPCIKAICEGTRHTDPFAGYTSIGSRSNTAPNECLRLANGNYLPAYALQDVTKERNGRT